MTGSELADLGDRDLSIAFTAEIDRDLARHLGQHIAAGLRQEDLAFAYWRQSKGDIRNTAIIFSVALPAEGERLLQGNVSFTPEYVRRVLDERPPGAGIALLHSHFGPGWQGMSDDDVVAERDRLAGLVAGATGMPLVGLTWGTDGTWSGRFWLRASRHRYERRWASSVRSVGSRLRMSFHPSLRPPAPTPESQVATISVWGHRAQEELSRLRVGIVGLGSVGSIVAEALSRTGVSSVVLIDHDHIERRNLDRTLGAWEGDADLGLSKVAISKRLIDGSHTSPSFKSLAIERSIVAPDGLAQALDCDVIFSCVDRPWPRHVLNAIAYAHLIPVIDGGIFARVRADGTLLHVDWRIHTVGPERACLYCLGALRRSDAALDRDGMLDDPDYLAGLSAEDREQYERRNVFAFSLSVASHQVLQFAGLVTGNPRIGGTGPQMYHAFPGTMEVLDVPSCAAECDSPSIIGTAVSPI